MLEGQSGFGYGHGVDNLAPGGQGLARMRELVFLKVSSSVVELQRNVQLVHWQVIGSNVFGGVLLVKFVPHFKQFDRVHPSKNDAFADFNKT